MELTDQLTKFEERLLDQTEELQRANTALEQMKLERDAANVARDEQLQRVVDERNRLQVWTGFTLCFKNRNADCVIPKRDLHCK